MSRNGRIAVLVGALVVIIAGTAIAISSGGSNKSSHTSGHAYVYVVNGKPKGGVQLLVYNKGQMADFTVVSDVSDEIHVHGFNFKKDVKAGGSVTFTFPATDVGDHVVELEGRGEQIANLRVL